MRIVGEWFRFDDGITRPIVIGHALAADGSDIRDRFLIDSGADRTVLSSQVLTQLNLTPTAPASGNQLAGVGGSQGYVLIQTTLRFTREDGVPIHIRGEFAAFTDPSATDVSILGGRGGIRESLRRASLPLPK